MASLTEGDMGPYSDAVEQKMKQFAGWLSEKDRRRYAAVEALKLGHGGSDHIGRLRQEYQAAGDPVISIDTKKKELLGNFHRAGTTYTEQTVETFDHDFGSAGEGKLIPHGIYDLANEHAHIHLNTSHDTSELCRDSIASWWEQHGRAAYPEAKRLLVLCDGGGSNSATQYLF